MYYGGDYGYANYGWHVPLFFLVFIPVIWFLFCLAVFVLWIWMLIDAIKYAPEKMKLVWVIVIIFTCIIGALIYYFVEHRPRIKAEKKEGK
ncbi:MAG: PLDc N-terminal domain-containing protein [Patescibacteria group bacterium]|nr:PLDc N-terminal domain-containing protein [Patescibacteria group bacterium]MDE1945722.1 PLDc N-terminal domain-containing protein [Patescibacteria group bacterium]